MNKIQFLKGFLGKIYLYLSGTIYPLAVDFLAYKYSGGSATLTKNSDRLTLALVTAAGWIYANNGGIDLTNYKTLWMYGSTSHATAGGTLSVQTNPSFNTHAASAAIPANNANAWISVDVSALNGTYFIRAGSFTSASMSVNVYQMYLQR